MRLESRSIKRRDSIGGPIYLQPQAKCPVCETWGDIDDDQLSGRVSLICEICGWHGNIEDGRAA